MIPVVVARAQNAASIIPDTVVRKNTARQTDLIDIGKALFRIRPKGSGRKPIKKFIFRYCRSAALFREETVGL